MNNGKLREALSELELQTDLWWLAMLLIGLACSVLAAWAFPDARPFWLYLGAFLRISMAAGLAQQDWGGIFRRLLPLGAVGAVFSIFADFLAVAGFEAGRKEYLTSDARILATPLYMPAVWTCAFVEMGYLMLRAYGIVSRRWSGQTALGLAMLGGGGVAAVMSACHDILAIKAGWWRYETRNAHAVIGDAWPVYAGAGSFLLFGAFLLVFARYLACVQSRSFAALRFGIILGGAAFLGQALSYLVLEAPF